MVTRKRTPKKVPSKPNVYGIIRREPVLTCYSKNPIRLPIPDTKPADVAVVAIKGGLNVENTLSLYLF